MVFRSVVLAISFTTFGFASASYAQSAFGDLKVLKTFDGQTMACLGRNDLVRPAYRIKSATGVATTNNVEITMAIETLKCVERGGVFGFESVGLGGRMENALGGFMEFSSLELVGYTPDFKVVKAQSIDLQSGTHTVTMTAPLAGFSTLLTRNVNGSLDRRVILMAFLRGQTALGDSKTGQVIDRTSAAFGAYNIVLSENQRTLTFTR